MVQLPQPRCPIRPGSPRAASLPRPGGSRERLKVLCATVHVDGEPTRSCVTPISALGARHVTTIEGLSGPQVAVLKAAWIDVDVVQCGYCQSGQLMTAAALLRQIPKPTDADIDAAMAGTICRCGTYPRRLCRDSSGQAC